MIAREIRISGRAVAGKLVLAVGCATAILPAAPCFAAAFSQIIVFGDSTVDSGYYRALSKPGATTGYDALWPAAVAYGAGVPTSSPGLIYSQVLAAHFGLLANPANQPGGTNYATSGAKNVDLNTSVNGGFKAAIPTVTQIANYLAANGNHADATALYLISSGGNDVSFASGLSGSGPYPSDPTAYMTSRANSLASAIASLKTAGATRFVVANQPASFPLNNAAQQQLKAAYNQALFSNLANLGVTITQADINSVRLAIQSNPGLYGFTSTSNAAGHTACTAPAGITSAWGLLCSSNPNSPSTFSAPDADMTNLFADDQHLATAGQKIIADYIYNLLLLTLPAPNPSPTVIEFYNTRLDNYFITADANEAAAIDNGSAGPGWSRTGYNFNSGGNTPVCRFYGSQSPGPNSHFYTVDAAECQGLKDAQFAANDPRKLTVKSWNFESLDFISTASITPPTGASAYCAIGLIPVYRAYNNGFSRGVDSNHRITSSQVALQEVVARGWTSEGVVMCAPP